MSRAASQSRLLVAMKGGVRVGLKQATSAPRFVLLVVGGGGAKVRVVKLSSCAGASVRGVAKMIGSRREASRESRCIVSKY